MGWVMMRWTLVAIFGKLQATWESITITTVLPPLQLVQSAEKIKARCACFKRTLRPRRCAITSPKGAENEDGEMTVR